MAFIKDLAKGIAGTVTGNPFAVASTLIGGIGGLFGRGGGNEQTLNVIRQLSPEQQSFLAQLQGELGTPAFDASGIIRTTRERLGAESSALRQAALQRLQRGGTSALQTESALGGITTTGLRELGGTIANLQFSEQEAEANRRLDIFRQMAGVLSGTGTTSQTTRQTQATGAGFAQLFGAGLQGLLREGPFAPTQAATPTTGQTFSQFFRRGRTIGAPA